jgi:hypothetical protein
MVRRHARKATRLRRGASGCADWLRVDRLGHPPARARPTATERASNARDVAPANVYPAGSSRHRPVGHHLEEGRARLR